MVKLKAKLPPCLIKHPNIGVYTSTPQPYYPREYLFKSLSERQVGLDAVTNHVRTLR
jgi:hypothetical protein